MKVMLGVNERLFVAEILKTATGNITLIRTISKAGIDIGFTEEEHKELKFVNNGTTLRWTDIGEKEFDIGDSVWQVISDHFKELSEADPPKLTIEHLSMFEKFVSEDEGVQE
jgi:hypothetical protein|tara:strand:- start:5634 stop:5969 length:336 start_codon:yes stop_codon:yes gene_type:complete